MSNEEMWDKLFERVDEFKSTDEIAKSALVLALHTADMLFTYLAVRYTPRLARAHKNEFIRKLRKSSMSSDSFVSRALVEEVNTILTRNLRHTEKALAKKT